MYKTYRDRYTRFWRQYFDPIAVRLDTAPGGGLALETFILPLIDNSLYTGLKETLGASAAAPLRTPEYDQPAIAAITLRAPAATRELLHDFGRSLFALNRIISALDTSSVSLTIRDAAPVVQANFPGFSSLAGDNLTSDFISREMFFAVPFAMSLLTRPCDIAIPVADEAQMRRILRAMPAQIKNNDWRTEYSLESQWLDDREMLLVAWTLFGVVRVELGLTVEHGWLNISNHPWTPAKITGAATGDSAHAALALTPSAIDAGRGQAHSIIKGREAAARTAAAFALQPWRDAFGAGIPEAVAIQRAALGHATPLPPNTDENAGVNRGVAINPADPFPAYIPDLRLWLRFETGGLRTRAEFLPPK